MAVIVVWSSREEAETSANRRFHTVLKDIGEGEMEGLQVRNEGLKKEGCERRTSSLKGEARSAAGDLCRAGEAMLATEVLLAQDGVVKLRR